MERWAEAAIGEQEPEAALEALFDLCGQMPHSGLPDALAKRCVCVYIYMCVVS
jgi:hypothetical protein